ncbi:MAG: hypothetical protein AAFR57_15795, partial [Pseudomonadota bacterium]
MGDQHGFGHIQPRIRLDQPHLGQRRTRDLARGQRVLIDLAVEPLHGLRIEPPRKTPQRTLQFRKSDERIGANEWRALIDREEIQIVLEQDQRKIRNLPVRREHLDHIG